MPITVRPARIEDIDWLMVQLQAFSRFYGTKQSLFGDPEYVRAALAGMIHNHLLLVAEREDLGLVGLIGGLVTLHPFNPTIRSLAEVFWWVAETVRGTFAGGEAATLLLDEYLDWGRANATWITFSREAHSPISERSLVRRGFKFQEEQFLMEVV
jgi:RimJ/RimL family protein N-acetyltransferase